MPAATLVINLRDTGGGPLDAPGVVTLKGGMENSVRVATTQDASAATFQGVTEGEYDAEAQCVGYQTTTEHVSVAGLGSVSQVYIYLPRESETKSESSKPQGTIMSPKLQSEMDKGLEALRHRQFELARTHFAKGARLAPGNPDVFYLLGVAESSLNHADLARGNFQHALSLDPGHERALLALGELQLRSGETSQAITTFEQAYRINGAGWRTQFLLASAYAKAGRFADADSHAERAAALARDKGAEPLLLLGEIQQAEGKVGEARRTWLKLANNFPGDPAAQKARQNLATLSEARPAPPAEELAATLPVHALPSLDLAPPAERPWAPLDVDSLEYPLAQNTACQADDILLRAQRRLRSQLENFEKFTATEHIEHQEIDRYGQPGPVRSRDFSYIVFVYPYGKDSFFLDEHRDSLGPDDSFPTSLATIGLNNLGVSILQPASRDALVFRCEGLSSVRGRAAWQIHFEEKKGSLAPIREWRRNGKLYDIPLKGRVWISSASFDVIRVETDLREPVESLQLTRDHLSVDYGPVAFHSAGTSLWLPLSAEMYMEVRGHRYHHKHYLTDYLLFEVDTNHKIGKPKNPPPPVPEASQLVAPNSGRLSIAP